MFALTRVKQEKRKAVSTLRDKPKVGQSNFDSTFLRQLEENSSANFMERAESYYQNQHVQMNNLVSVQSSEITLRRNILLSLETYIQNVFL